MLAVINPLPEAVVAGLLATETTKSAGFEINSLLLPVTVSAGLLPDAGTVRAPYNLTRPTSL